MEPDEVDTLLTDAELDRMERWIIGADSANPSPPQNTPDRRRVSDNHVLALIQGVRAYKRKVAAAELRGARAMQEAAKQACEDVRDSNASGDDDPKVFAAAGACFLGVCALSPESVVKEADR